MQTNTKQKAILSKLDTIKTTPIEHRRWFNIIVGILSVSIALICMLIVRFHVPKEAQNAQLALGLLFVGSVSGFTALFRLFLPLILLKIWPKLEESNSVKN